MSDGGLDSFWNSLRRAEHRIEAEATEAQREIYQTVYGYKSRVMRLRSALAKSGPIAFQTVTTKLEGIKLDAIWSILFSAVRDMALYYGGSVVLGTAIGAGLGSLAFGVGAIPGAAIGAEAGNVVGEWVLIYLGLKMLAEGLVNTIPPALRLYVQGFRIAWGPTENDRPDARYSADYYHGEDMAAHRFADGHVLMIMAILIAIVAYLTRGKSEEALMQAVRKSERLGTKMADWLEENKGRLLKNDNLKPKVVERAPSQETQPDELRKKRNAGATEKGSSSSGAPPSAESNEPSVPKAPPSESERIALARQRQYQMLKDNVGYNISPTSWNQYPTIGLNGTYITDQAGVTQYLGELSGQSEMTISSEQAAQIESGMGLNPGSLQDGFQVRQVTGITDMAPRSPMEGNSFFLGPGNHLPNGAPEMVVSPISTVDNPNVTTLLTVHVQ